MNMKFSWESAEKEMSAEAPQGSESGVGERSVGEPQSYHTALSHCTIETGYLSLIYASYHRKNCSCDHNGRLCYIFEVHDCLWKIVFALSQADEIQSSRTK